MSTIGSQVLVLVPPATNRGVDVLPATVVGVKGDQVDVVTVYGQLREGVPLFPDRPAADASLDEQRTLLPGKDRDPSDVYEWVTAAFPVEVPAPAPATPES